MRRIWLDNSLVRDSQFELSDEAFTHAIQVSRFRVGDKFEIISGAEYALHVQITEIKKKSATVKVIGQRALPSLLAPYVNLAFAISKWSTFEEVLEKSVELGVHTVQPLITDFSFIRSKKDWPEARVQRFKKIICGATEQSGRGKLMEIKEPLSLQEFSLQLNRTKGAAGLFAYEGQSGLNIKAELSRLSQGSLNEMWAIVGSEGGFSIAEVDHMRQSGIPQVTLGGQILRAETACFAMVSVIKYELGLMR